MSQGVPFVGRDEQLRRIAGQLSGGTTGGVLIVGAPGVGKTRLAQEALEHAPPRTTVVWAAATRSAATIPYGALVDLLPDLSSEQASGPEFLGRIIKHVACRGHGRQVILGVDNAHLLDQSSAALLHHLALSGAAQLLATARTDGTVPDAVTALWKEGLVDRIDLDPLNADQADQLVQAALGARLDGATGRRLWELSGGNPLFLMELLAGARESGALTCEAGVWRAGGSLASKGRLTEIVETRLGRLAPPVHAALQLVALAEPMELAVLEELAAAETLQEAEASGLLRITTDGRRARARIEQPLHAELLRATLPALRARDIRCTLAETIHRCGARRREDLLRIASWRLEGGALVDPALFLSAARRASQLFDPALGARLALAAVDAGGGFAARLVAAEALHVHGDAVQAEKLLAGLESVADGGDSRGRVALLRAENLMTGFGRLADAEAVLRRGATGVAKPGLRQELDVLRGRIELNQGRARHALTSVLPTLGDPRATPEAALRALLVAVPAWVHAGRAETGAAAAERLLERATTPGGELPHVAELLRLGLCFAYGMSGRWQEAQTLAAGRYQTALAHRADELRAAWALAQGQFELAVGRAQPAVEWLREAALLFSEQRSAFGVFSLAWCLGCLAEASALAGDPAAASAALNEADAVTPEQSFTPPRAIGRVWTAAARGELAQARALALEAADTAGRMGSLGIEAFALYQLVRLDDAASAVDRLALLADAVEGRLMPLHATHAAASAARDPAALAAVSARFEELGALLPAAEAAAEVCRALRPAAGAAQTRAAARAQRLAGACEGARSPLLGLASDAESLTERETQITALAAEGASNRTIAEHLSVSVRTVDNHLHRAYSKLGISGRAELTAVAHERIGTGSR